MGASRAFAGVLVVAGLVLAGAGSAAAWDTPDGSSRSDSTIVVDGVTLGNTITARGTERGGNPTDVSGVGAAVGTAVLGPVFNGSGPIVCLDVRGNTAGVTVHLTQSTDPALIGHDAYGTFVDNGPSGDRGQVFPVGSATSCAPQPTLATAFTSGRVVITDGSHPTN